MGFAEIIGQKNQLDILRLALANNRLHHAYLFTGPEGVGKRTTALALAMALHCTEKSGDFCGRCAECARVKGAQSSRCAGDRASGGQERDQHPADPRYGKGVALPFVFRRAQDRDRRSGDVAEPGFAECALENTGRAAAGFSLDSHCGERRRALADVEIALPPAEFRASAAAVDCRFPPVEKSA